MPSDPMTLFGGLMRACIREDETEDRKVLTESLVFLIAGVACSVLTTYVLASLNILV
jgi:hypothetical protein